MNFFYIGLITYCDWFIETDWSFSFSKV